jgi:predicted nucleic acid-binding protein
VIDTIKPREPFFHAAEVWITEPVLLEVGNAMSRLDRIAAEQFIAQCYQTRNMRVVSVDTPLLLRALDLYRSHADKSWGMTDCVSFVVMRENRRDARESS